MSQSGLFAITHCFTTKEAQTLIDRLQYPKELEVCDEYGILVAIPERSQDWEVDVDDDDEAEEKAYMLRYREIHQLRKKITSLQIDLAKEEGRPVYVLEKAEAVIFQDEEWDIVNSELRRLAQWAEDNTVSRSMILDDALAAATRVMKDGIVNQDGLWRAVFQDFIVRDHYLMHSYDWYKEWSQSSLFDGIVRPDDQTRRRRMR